MISNNHVLKVIASLALLQSAYHILAGELIENDVEDDPEITPFSVKEEGCPIVTERYQLNLTKLNGNWSMPFASMNWLADIGMSLFYRSVKVSEITNICPAIILNHTTVSETSNATWTFVWKCPKLNGEFELRCWPQSNVSQSKFICWNNRENRDIYMMVGATNHANWIVFVRCSPGEPEKPSEGMSWAILSKQVEMDSDISEVLFSLLEGYGFDVEEFKVQLRYKECEAKS